MSWWFVFRFDRGERGLSGLASIIWGMTCLAAFEVFCEWEDRTSFEVFINLIHLMQQLQRHTQVLWTTRQWNIAPKKLFLTSMGKGSSSPILPLALPCKTVCKSHHLHTVEICRCNPQISRIGFDVHWDQGLGREKKKLACRILMQPIDKFCTHEPQHLLFQKEWQQFLVSCW